MNLFPFKRIRFLIEQSLAITTLLRFAVRITLVVLCVATLSYWHIVSNLEAKTHGELKSYVLERGKKESSIFRLAQDNHQIFKQAFIALWAARQHEQAEDFDKYFVHSPDDIMRTRRTLFDGTNRVDGTFSQGISGFIGKGAPLDSREFRNKMIFCLELLDRFAPAWRNRFINTFCYGPENAVVVAQPGTPWAFDTPANYDAANEEVAFLIDPKHNPRRQTIWTGLYFDSGAKQFTVSAATPVDIDGVHRVNIGIDIPLGTLLKSVTQDHIDGASNFIVRPDGRMIAHATLLSALDAKAEVTVESLRNPTLSSMYQQIIAKLKTHHQTPFVLDDKADDALLAVTRIDGPGWLFVTVYPKSLLNSTARSAASFILGISLLSLLLELVMLHFVMKSSVTEPIRAFVRASEAVANGDYLSVASGAVAMPEQRRDEIGLLARTFRTMSQQVDNSHNQLAASEKRYHGIFNNSHDAIIIICFSGQILDANPATEAIFGYSTRAGETFNINALYNDEQIYQALISRVQSGEIVRDVELKLRHKNGTLIDTLVAMSLCHDVDGQIIGLQNTIRDATALKAAEHLRRQYQMQLEQEVAERTQQLSETVLQLEQQHQQLNLHHAQMAESEARRVETLQQNSDTLEHLGAIGQEITAHLETNLVCEALNRHVHHLLDVSSFAVFLMEPNGSAMSLAFGIDEGQAMPPIRLLMANANADLLRCLHERREIVLNQDLATARQNWIPSSQQTLSCLAAPLCLDDQVLGMMVIQSCKNKIYGAREQLIFRTLCAYTAIALSNAEAHEKLAKAHTMLKETQQHLIFQGKMAGLGTLTAGVAHEINNPTNFVHVAAQNQQIDIAEFQQFVTRLIENDESGEILQAFNDRFGKLSENIHTILNGTGRIIGIVKDLRSFTRLDEAETKSVQLAQCILSTINLVRTSWLEKVEFVTDFIDSPEIECWPALLNQVFMNLLVNACQAIMTRQLGGNPAHGRITVRMQIIGNQIEISFTDNGSGMPPAVLARIMEPFFTTKTVGEGTGLGLSIAYGIVKKHGGDLLVSSVQGEGSCFTLVLPIPPDELYWSKRATEKWQAQHPTA